MTDNLDAFFPLSILDTARKPRKRSPKKDCEAGVLRECIQFLKVQPQVRYLERRNTGAVQFEGGGFLRFGAKGAADIWCLIYHKETTYVGALPVNGYFLTHVEIECKRRDGKGRQSAAQKVFEQHCIKIGVPYLLVTSAGDLNEKLHDLRLLGG